MNPQLSNWQSLHDQFINLVCDSASENSRLWYDAWHLLLQHAWFRAQLRSVSRYVLRVSHAPLDWQEDVEQEVVMLLVRRLRKDPTLGVDRERAKRHFPGWMRKIIMHDCRDAVRKLRRRQTSTISFAEELEASRESVDQDMRLDLAHAMNTIDKEEQAILMLHSRGLTLRQVASTLDVTFWRTYRMYHRGLEDLQRCINEDPSN